MSDRNGPSSDDSAVDSAVDVLCVSAALQRVALPLESVREVLPAAAVTPLPHAPEVIHGLMNLRGEPLPVLSLRARLGLPRRPIEPDDHFVVCRVGKRDVGVWVDRADELLRLDDIRAASPDGSGSVSHVAGAAMLEDGCLLVSDVQSFLTPVEHERLELALASSTGVGGDD